MDEPQLKRAKAGEWVALLANPPLMATGGSRTEALQNLELKKQGKTPKNERPYLKLCKDCNKRAAEAGDKAHLEGVEVCLACAAAIDQWEKDFKRWQSRKARNARKAKRATTAAKAGQNSKRSKHR